MAIFILSVPFPATRTTPARDLPMKKILILLLPFVLLAGYSCTPGKLDEGEARRRTEALLHDLQEEKYDALDSYYITSFNRSEPLEEKVQKYLRLQETTGPILSYAFISATAAYDEASGYNQLTLVYKVTCSRVALRETFIWVKDEGQMGILFQNMENWKEDDPSSSGEEAP